MPASPVAVTLDTRLTSQICLLSRKIGRVWVVSNRQVSSGRAIGGSSRGLAGNCSPLTGFDLEVGTTTLSEPQHEPPTDNHHTRLQSNAPRLAQITTPVCNRTPHGWRKSPHPFAIERVRAGAPTLSNATAREGGLGRSRRTAPAGHGHARE